MIKKVLNSLSRLNQRPSKIFGNQYKQELELILLFVRRDLNIRYRRSLLGLLWTMLNPLLSSLVLWFIFSHVFHSMISEDGKFAPYLLAGVLIVNFFSQGFMQSAESIINGSGILKKIYVKPYIFCIAASISNAINFVFGLTALVIIDIISGGQFTFTAIQVIPIVIFMISLITGLGLVCSILFIRFDDFRNITVVLIQLLTYLTPIFYPKTILSESMSRLISLNVLTSYLDVFRFSFLGIGYASILDWIYISISSIGALIIGIKFFKHNWTKTLAML